MDFRKVSIGFFILLLAVKGFPTEKMPLQFISEQPGNCFSAGQPVRFELFRDEKVEIKWGGNLEIFDVNNQVLDSFPLKTGSFFKTNGLAWEIKHGNKGLQFEISGLPVGFYIARYQAGPYLRFVVIPDNPYIGPSPFAMDTAFSWFVHEEHHLRQAADLLQKAGIRRIRDRMAWTHVQPSAGEWDWGRYDGSTRTQDEAGLEVYQIFHDSAPWASRYEGDNTETARKFPPRNLNYLENFLEKAAGRYKNEIDAWEIWNEMDATFFFAGVPEEYAALLQKGYYGVKEGNPEAQVLLGSMCLMEGELVIAGKEYEDRHGIDFLDMILQCGAGDYFDIYNFHYYGPPEGLAVRARQDYAMLRKYGLENRPVWLTEIGKASSAFSSSTVLPSEREQAAYLIKIYTIAASLGVEKTFFFIFPTFLEHGVSHWGIYAYSPEKGWSPKPAYLALAEMTARLQEAEGAVRYQWEDQAEGIYFPSDKNAAPVLVLWSIPPHGSRLSLIGGPFETADMFGKTLEANGEEYIELSPEPIYLSGPLEPLLIQGQKQERLFTGSEKRPAFKSPRPPVTLLARCEPPVAVEEEPVTGIVQVYNETDSTRQVRLHLESSIWDEGKNPSQETIKIPAGEMMEKTFTLEAGATGKEAFFEAVIFENNKEVARSPAFLDLTRPLEVKIVQTRAGRENPEETDFRFTLRNRSGQEIKPLISISREEESKPVLRMEPELIPPGSTKMIERKLPEDFKFSPDYRMDFNGQSRPVVMDRPVVHRIFRPNESQPKVEFKHVQIRQQCTHGAGEWNGPDDLSGTLKTTLVMAPEGKGEELILEGQVIDDDVVPPLSPEQPWVGDGVEFFLDLRQEDLGKAEYGPGVFQFFLLPPSPLFPEGRLAMWQPDIQEMPEEYFQIERTMQGYQFRVAFPVEALETESLADRKLIGLDWVLDDLDSFSPRHTQMVWQGTANNWRDPSGFPLLRLE